MKSRSTVPETSFEGEFLDSGLPSYELDRFKHRDQPSAFNSLVIVRRYRIAMGGSRNRSAQSAT